jgi:hypothetical protein
MLRRLGIMMVLTEQPECRSAVVVPGSSVLPFGIP